VKFRSSLVVAFSIAVLATLAIGPRAEAEACQGLLCEVEADAADSAIVGTGRLVLPPTFTSDRTSRDDAAACGTCSWRTQPVCVSEPSQGLPCLASLGGCPGGQYRVSILRRLEPGAQWEDVGQVCVGPGSRPVLVSEAADRVRDRFVDRLPPPHPSYQPADGAIVNLPTIFASGQRGGADSDDFDLLGMPVHVDAKPSWLWDFGDGTTLRTDKAGGRYPDKSVTHTYEREGTAHVTVSSSWLGTFTVDGLGPFDVAGGAVTQDAAITVTVRSAAGQLVAH
jgi:hypothetical protein